MEEEKKIKVLELKHNLDAQYGASITGKLTWKNISLPAGTSLVAFFFLGKSETVYGFAADGEEYLIGSIVELSAPAMGTTVTTDIPSRAMFSDGWDVWALIGILTGTVRTIEVDGRIIGLHAGDINEGYLSYYDAAWFTGVLSVLAGANLTGSISWVSDHITNELVIFADIENVGGSDATNVVATLYCSPAGALDLLSGSNPQSLGTISPGVTKRASWTTRILATCTIYVQLSYVDSLTGDTITSPTPPGAPVT